MPTLTTELTSLIPILTPYLYTLYTNPNQLHLHINLVNTILRLSYIYSFDLSTSNTPPSLQTLHSAIFTNSTLRHLYKLYTPPSLQTLHSAIFTNSTLRHLYKLYTPTSLQTPPSLQTLHFALFTNSTLRHLYKLRHLYNRS